MAPRSSNTRERIVKAARALVRKGGPAALTFDAVANRLGVTKQAVIYWFPNKEALGVAVVLPGVESEAQMGIAAVSGTSDPNEARAAFVNEIARFHLADLERFRLMYLAPQMGARLGKARGNGAINTSIHPVTRQMYDALAAALDVPGKDPQATRREAVALHFAILGVVMMQGLTEAIDDPLRHDADSLIEALSALVAEPLS
ncbi:TetR/AcrR family transcriptional regulator [Natronohydrobacter thiooxidans]|uniref:TetR/AcrR family transcriptional regulator n=1 Tax=Natronohydrobacter thiooxidans TaxID=87172 RepID=UPI0008FF3810|nr:TetR/AcrR family transcriptional regulator [Natronohydrobacter thiooxidans]